MFVSNWGASHLGWGKQFELGTKKAFQQWFVLAPKNSPALGAIIRRVILNLIFYKTEIHGTGKYSILRTTGPIAFTQSLLEQNQTFYEQFSSEEAGLLYSIYGDDFSKHKNKFEKHYSNIEEPILDEDSLKFLHKSLAMKLIIL